MILGKKHINAREKLWELKHDIERMLIENKNSKDIKEFIQKRLDRLEDTGYIAIDWN